MSSMQETGVPDGRPTGRKNVAMLLLARDGTDPRGNSVQEFFFEKEGCSFSFPQIEFFPSKKAPEEVLTELLLKFEFPLLFLKGDAIFDTYFGEEMAMLTILVAEEGDQRSEDFRKPVANRTGDWMTLEEALLHRADMLDRDRDFYVLGEYFAAKAKPNS